MTLKPAVELLASGQGQKVRFLHGTDPLTFSQVLSHWRSNEQFRSFWINLLAEAPFSAYRWETPALTLATTDQPFECVLLDAPTLDRPADRSTFAQHFQKANPEAGVVSFPNLGRDALLVVPCPRTPADDYSHLAAFTNNAPAKQQHALWQLVGQTTQDQLSQSPLWLNTAGMGVAWLHIRLDCSPKYYAYGPYRRAPS